MKKARWIPFLLLALTVVPVAIAICGQRVIYEGHSDYNHIIVKEDEDGLRYLLFSETGGYQSVRKPGDTEVLELPYSRVMMVGFACVEEPEKVLLVGLGGGSIPSFLHPRYPKTRIDCVDIDREVIAVAKTYFGFREDDTLKAHAADGRKFIEETPDRYDIVMLDAFGNDFIPRQLTTREFLQAVRKILSPNGIVLGNVWGRYSNALYDSMVSTYKDVFEQLYIFRVPERSNVILLAVPRKGTLTKDELVRKATDVAKKRRFPFDLAELLRTGYQDARDIETTDPVLVDEKPGDAKRAESDAGRGQDGR